MLEALRDGTADYLATDHAPHTLAEKEKGSSGQPHLDTYGPFVSWLLVEQGFTPERIAAICSANPGASSIPIGRRNMAGCCPGYVGSLTVLDLRHPTHGAPSGSEDALWLEPFRRHDLPGKRRRRVRAGTASSVGARSNGCKDADNLNVTKPSATVSIPRKSAPFRLHPHHPSCIFPW